MEQRIDEALQNRPMDKINWLITNGLGKDQSRMSYYRQIIQDPFRAIRNVIFRDYAAEILNNLLSFVFSDPVLYNRLRQLLAAKNGSARKMKPSAFESLIIKSEKKGIDLETLIEVYNRGYEDDSRPEWLSREQYAFNRVVSFIEGGEAVKLDEDLVNEKKSTINTIRKVIKR